MAKRKIALFYDEQTESNCAEMKSSLDNHLNKLRDKKKTFDEELAGYHVEEIRPKDDCQKELNDCQKEITSLMQILDSYSPMYEFED